MAKKEAELCGWCLMEALPDIAVAGHPVCELHRREISTELQANAGRTVSPTRAERAARQESLRQAMKVEAAWQATRAWSGR